MSSESAIPAVLKCLEQVKNKLFIIFFELMYKKVPNCSAHLYSLLVSQAQHVRSLLRLKLPLPPVFHCPLHPETVCVEFHIFWFWSNAVVSQIFVEVPVFIVPFVI